MRMHERREYVTAKLDGSNDIDKKFSNPNFALDGRLTSKLERDGSSRLVTVQSHSLVFGMSSVITIQDAEFATEVLNASQPVLVYFWASWCGPCRLMSPAIEWAASQYSDRLKIVKMEVDPNPEAVAKYQVEGVPALRFFRNGELVEATEGAINKQKLEGVLNAYLAATPG
ncbi:MAG TPA: thioredoxin family protein [Coleofasciculaceae cyanobacterium]